MSLNLDAAGNESGNIIIAERLAEYRSLVRTKLEPLELSRASAVARADDEVREWSDLLGQLRIFAHHLLQQEAAAAVPSSSVLAESGAVTRRPLKLHSDIGEGFFVHARVACEALESAIAIDVGAGVFIQMSLPEAISFVNKKLELLESSRATAQEQLATVRADLSMARTALDALTTL